MVRAALGNVRSGLNLDVRAPEVEAVALVAAVALAQKEATALEVRYKRYTLILGSHFSI